MLLLLTSVAQAATKLETYDSSSQINQFSKLQWKLNLGKSTEKLLQMPNGNILVTAGSKQLSVNPLGQVIWENKSSGIFGAAIIDSSGSIYAANASSIQETLPNGAKGWSFSSLPLAKSATSPWLVKGPEKLLYFPLPDALYAVNMQGHYSWSLFPWDSADTYILKTITAKRVFLDCAGDEHNCYVVYGEDADYRLAAIDGQGKFRWSYSLGNVTSAYLLADGQGKLYVSASYKSKVNRPGVKSKLLPGKLLCFQYYSNQPVWEQPLKIDTDITAPVLYGDYLYVTANSEVKAFTASNGSILWGDTLSKLSSSVSVDQQTGRIYVGNSDGYVFAIRPSGRMIWERKLDGAVEHPPLITADGIIYVTTNKGSLYKIQDIYKDS